MNIEQRIRLMLGDLMLQLQAALARIEELEAKLGERKDERDDSRVN